jgi:hypothetical protein
MTSLGARCTHLFGAPRILPHNLMELSILLFSGFSVPTCTEKEKKKDCRHRSDSYVVD